MDYHGCMLDGLDDVPWSRLRHAYGDASDVPGILRAVADGDQDAVDELFGNIWHQGTVYEATAYAVPFLVELLDADGIDKRSLFTLLRCVANGSSFAEAHHHFLRSSGEEAEDVRQKIEKERVWVRAAHEAVSAHVPALLRHLTAVDAEVRAVAVHALSACRRTSSDVPASFRGRLTEEESGLVRASLLFGLHALGAADLSVAESFLQDDSAIARVAAAVICVSGTPGPVPQRTLDVLRLGLPAAREDVRLLPWSESSDAVPWLLKQLGDRWAEQVQLLNAWMQADDAALRTEAVSASEVVMRWRPATARLVPLLAKALEDPERDVRYWAATQLAAAGAEAETARGALAAVLVREPELGNTPASIALRVLCSLHDARGASFVRDELLCAIGGARDVAWGSLPLASLGPWAADCLDPLIDAIRLAPAGNVRISVIEALGRYGDAARRAIPLIRKELRHHPHITTRVLGDLGPIASDSLGSLRRYLDHPDDIVAINAARAFWRIAGRADVALPVLQRFLERRCHGTSHALQALGEMGPESAALAPRLPALFDSNDDWVSARSAIAHWYMVGDAEAVLPTLERHLVCVPWGFEVARCLADIGPSARAVIPTLREAATLEFRHAASGVGRVVVEDEAWRALCLTALARIDPQ